MREPSPAKSSPRIGGRFRVLANIFANPDLPEIDDYYEPFDFDYQHLHTAGDSKHQPVARPRSLISGKRMQKDRMGPELGRNSRYRVCQASQRQKLRPDSSRYLRRV